MRRALERQSQSMRASNHCAFLNSKWQDMHSSSANIHKHPTSKIRIHHWIMASSSTISIRLPLLSPRLFYSSSS
ncbi:hypothetical protein RSAG8_09382, partial [Rhizoctonia solani AG-8 WAC10335]